MTFNAFKTYLSFTKISFLRQGQFRLANLSGLFTSLFFLLFRASLFIAIYEERTQLGGYSLGQTLTYLVLVQALIMVIPQWGSIGVQDDIRSGQIAMDLCRPLNYYLMILFKRIGASGFYLLGRSFPILILGYVLGYLMIMPQFITGILGLLSILLGVWLANSIHFLVELTGFWLESPRGVKMVVVGLTYFLSGATIPIALFPPWVQEFNKWLPFSYTLNTPIEVLLGSSSLYQLFLYQCIWVAITTILCFVALRLGERKVVLHGG